MKAWIAAAALLVWAAQAVAQGKAEVDAYNAESQRIQAEAQMINAQSLYRQRGGRGGGGSSGRCCGAPKPGCACG